MNNTDEDRLKAEIIGLIYVLTNQTVGKNQDIETDCRLLTLIVLGGGQICPRFFIIKNKTTFDRRYHSHKTFLNFYLLICYLFCYANPRG